MRNFIHGLWMCALPVIAQVSWKIDPSHSRIGFSIKHMGISEVEGEFRKVEVDVLQDIPQRWDNIHVKVLIDAASIDTRNEDRDEHLRSADFLDVEKYPMILFTSEGMKKIGKDEASGAIVYQMPGTLELHGITRPITLTVYHFGTIEDPWGNTRAGFRIRGQIDRTDFGITYAKKTKTGDLLIGKIVRFDMPIELIRSK